MKPNVRLLASLLGCALAPATVAAQPFETFGTRAAGMGGAFVAVADDASAVYWNPAGLASGSFFSLLIDRSTGTVKADNPLVGTGRSCVAIALGAPPIGLSYYRLRRTYTSAVAQPTIVPGGNLPIHVESLVTHHAGVTVLHSLTDAIAVGATLKLVRGIAAAGVSSGLDRDDVLAGSGDEFSGRASTKFDADVGIMASLGILKAGLTVRNLAEPEFPSAQSGRALKADRQVRAGVSFLALQSWLMAIDFDLTRETDPFGDRRNIAAGLEGRVHRRASVRGGVRVNTLDAVERLAAVTGGASLAVFGSTFVDGQVTAGSSSERGWGIAARVLF